MIHLKTVNELLSAIPQGNKDKNEDKEILRAAIIAELDAINLYEQMASNSTNKKLKKVLLDVAREEKTHIGEFQALLLEIDQEQKIELKKGKEEILY
jgi:rubrerythrin